MVQVCGMSQCAKIHYCTHTHTTHFPVPMLNPNGVVPLHSCLFVKIIKYFIVVCHFLASIQDTQHVIIFSSNTVTAIPWRRNSAVFKVSNFSVFATSQIDSSYSINYIYENYIPTMLSCAIGPDRSLFNMKDIKWYEDIPIKQVASSTTTASPSSTIHPIFCSQPLWLWWRVLIILDTPHVLPTGSLIWQCQNIVCQYHT